MLRRPSLPTRLAVTLLLSSLVLTYAPAAEPGTTSWLGRMFKGNAVPEAEKDSTGKRAASLQTEAAAAKKLRADLDWKRRAEVCQKLREIAAETSDTGLERLAERLDQRAWDVFLRQTGQTPAGSLDEQILGSKLGVDASARTGAASKSRGTDASQAQIREVRP